MKHPHDDEDFDERGVLRDGRRVRVPLMMMDSLQRAIHDQYDHLTITDVADAIETDNHVTVVDAFGGLALHQPGYRYLNAGHRSTDHAVQVTRDAMRSEARADYVRTTCDAWKPGFDREITVAPITGDARTDAYLARKEHDANAWRGPSNSGKW
jgi:hypothetical protein